MLRKSSFVSSCTLLGLLAACPSPGEPAAEGDVTGSSESSSSDEVSDTDDGTDTGTEDDSTGEPPTCDALDPGGLEPEVLDLPDDCDEVLDNCKEDEDRDGVPLACDNDPDLPNPAQRDADGDGFGDVGDLCPVIASETNTGDSDKDGLGNACDNCAPRLSLFNEVLEAANVPFASWVRNVPAQRDSDRDGVGDACDNCPAVPNCGDFGPERPAAIGDAVPIDDPAICQTDSDADGIGDACETTTVEDAAGPMGFGPADDLDQDGLRNEDDLCLRLAVEPRACSDDADCSAASACVDGRCNHADHDGDGVGTACDTCPSDPNPEQLDVDGARLDDPDGDFIGNACETAPDCSGRFDPRTIGFYDVAVEGYCCVTTYPGDDELVDADGRPVRADCTAQQEERGQCRAIPADVWSRPGIGVLPPGCEEALAHACKIEASPVSLEDVGGDLAAWWDHACQLPPRDHDFDGHGNSCDLCPDTFDPTNESYVDETGTRWPNDGRYCNGAYDPSEFDPANACEPG